MQKTQFKYDYLVFLHAYLRHVNLSLDRSRWGEWQELKEYYKNRIDPLTVAKSLSLNSDFVPKNQKISLIFPVNILSKCESFISGIVLKEYYMTINETQYCYQLLFQLDDFLHLDVKTYNTDIETLRINVVMFNRNVLEPKLKNKDINRVMNIEHFLQNIEVIKFDKLIKNILL